MNTEKLINELFDFIKSSPTAFHATETVAKELRSNGYTELFECEAWSLAEGGKYFVRRGGTSVIAFRYSGKPNPFMICASHGDTPTFRVKGSEKDGKAYGKLLVERYGGPILYSWFDRPLSVAGRVMVRTEGGIEARLVNIDRDMAVIPSLAIHLNPSVNEKFSPSLATDTFPLLSGADGVSIEDIIANECGARREMLISHDLFLYNRDAGKRYGNSGEFILVPRLDDLACAFTSMKAFIDAKDNETIPVLAVFDNEEVGSETKQGAASTFLSDILERIIPDKGEYLRSLAASYMVSADNAHAKHPNHPELSDAANAPTLSGGVVIKYNANQKYATDGLSAALFKIICERAGVKVQLFYNRPDLPGGSTLGSISNTKVSVPTVDIGIPQLAMHSATETAAAEDIGAMYLALCEMYSVCLDIKNDEIIIK